MAGPFTPSFFYPGPQPPGMDRRDVLRAGAVAGTTPLALAGCSSLPGSPTTDRDEGADWDQLVGVTFFVDGVARGTDGTALVVAPSASTDSEIRIDVADNAGPLVGTENESGAWVWERHSEWESVPDGADVCASVRLSPGGDLEAVKVLVHAVCSFQRPPES